MSTFAIQVEGLSKRYRIGACRQGYSTLRETLSGLGGAVFRRLRAAPRRSHAGDAAQPDSTVWALRDVGFDVRSGEVVGIIGHNGSGKSTLLKILSCITEPTAGCATTCGRVGSLLEVGTGFHPELTGRENIYLNGAILGMRRCEIGRRLDEIVAFAEIERFLETPVKRYSSGMYVRLAFAVAAHLDPDILLVDEVLAVGDAPFQKKCLRRIGESTRAGRTVVLVSHHMGAIHRLCDRVLWLAGGQVVMHGAPEDVVSRYLAGSAGNRAEQSWDKGVANDAAAELRVLAVRVLDAHAAIAGHLDIRRPFFLEVCYRIIRPLPHCRVGFLVHTADGTPVCEVYDTDGDVYPAARAPGCYATRCAVPGHLLNAGSYVVSVNAGIPNVKNLAFIEAAVTFSIEDTDPAGFHMDGSRKGVLRPRLTWTSAAA